MHRVNDFSLSGNETPDKLDFFVVDVLGILRAKKALFFPLHANVI